VQDLCLFSVRHNEEMKGVRHIHILVVPELVVLTMKSCFANLSYL